MSLVDHAHKKNRPIENKESIRGEGRDTARPATTCGEIKCSRLKCNISPYKSFFAHGGEGQIASKEIRRIRGILKLACRGVVSREEGNKSNSGEAKGRSGLYALTLDKYQDSRTKHLRNRGRDNTEKLGRPNRKCATIS